MMESSLIARLAPRVLQGRIWIHPQYTAGTEKRKPAPLINRERDVIRSGELRLFAGDGLGREVYVPICADEEAAAIWAFRFSDIVGKFPDITLLAFRKVEKDVAFSTTDNPESWCSEAFSRLVGLFSHNGSLFEKNKVSYTGTETYARSNIRY
jgi:hypothetical protein